MVECAMHRWAAAARGRAASRALAPQVAQLLDIEASTVATGLKWDGSVVRRKRRRSMAADRGQGWGLCTGTGASTAAVVPLLYSV